MGSVNISAQPIILLVQTRYVVLRMEQLEGEGVVLIRLSAQVMHKSLIAFTQPGVPALLGAESLAGLGDHIGGFSQVCSALVKALVQLDQHDGHDAEGYHDDCAQEEHEHEARHAISFLGLRRSL